MRNKKVTFIISTNDRGGTYRLVIPTGIFKIIVVVGVAVFVGFSSAVVDYAGLLVQSMENKSLKLENHNLRNQFDFVEGQLNALEKSLERVNLLSAKLKLITNIEDPDRTLKLSLGPGPKAGQNVERFNEPLSQRQPAAALGGNDTPLMGTKPLIEAKDELFVESERGYASLAIRIDQAVKETQLQEQNILALWESLSARQSLLNATPSMRPVGGWFTSRFGYRVSPFTGRPVMHNGVDIAASPGAPVYAPADGVVSYAGYDPGYGKLVTIDHGYGVVTRYGHNSRLFVTLGQRVKRRDIISAVGNTGRSTGPHLHYEVRVNEIPVDPKNYILDE